MVEYINIGEFTPAEYNPREISDEQFEKLKESIGCLGMISPILVNAKNNVIIAGHQRTKACNAIGVSVVPVIFIEGIMLGDEIKFNRLHNAIDRSEKVKSYLVEEYPKEEFLEINSDRFKVGSTSASFVKEICKLINRYGNCLSCIVCNGEVIVGENYIKACSLLNVPVITYVCEDGKMEALQKYMYQDYGEYSYKGIERQTFVQGLAQMHRSTEKQAGKKQNASSLYENLVLPDVFGKNVSILDFGCGKGDYIRMLAQKHLAIGVEFFNNNGKQIIVSKGNKQIDALIEHIEKHGLFDVVVCDSVLNSVDSVEAEISVISCLNLFLKEGGKLYISGRPIESTMRKNFSKDIGNTVRYLEFLDNDDFTANFREGKWYFQHYNSRDKITKRLDELGFDVENVCWGKYGSCSFQIVCIKRKNLSREQYRAAVEFEFNLPLPNGRRYNRHGEIIRLMGLEG